MPRTIEFAKRCRTDTTLTSRRRIWQSRCGRFRVVHSRCLFGPRKGPHSIPDVYRAELRDEIGWGLISSHRCINRAIQACQSWKQ